MATKTILNPQIREEIKTYRDLLHQQGIKTEMIYVFGSQAIGKAKKWSDIDVGVISPNFSDDRQKERVKLMRLSQRINLAIEPHPFCPADFNNPYYPLAREVKKYGIKID